MLRLQIRNILIFVVFGFGLFVTLLPFANAVIISPVQIDLSLKTPVGSFTVTNDSDVLLTYQSTTLSWEQKDGQDVQAETQDLIVTPPIVSIKPKSVQVFRVALFNPNTSLTEQSYRIILEDISTEVTEKADNGLRFRFNHNLPVFYAPLRITDSLAYSICESPATGKGCVLIENTGNRHAKIIQLTAASANLEEPSAISKTILAGSSNQWLFSSMLGAELTTSIKLVTNKGHLNLNLKDLPRSK
jgi:fimbrial chaperone protein